MQNVNHAVKIKQISTHMNVPKLQNYFGYCTDILRVDSFIVSMLR